MTGEQTRTEDWKTLPWKKFQRNVFRLQKRIYQAEVRGDFKRVRNLQRLLLRSYSARCLAVRQVSQDNRGKNTPGVDGIARLTPKQRMRMVRDLRTLSPKPAPIRRVYIPKASDPKESRPLGIPVMRDRAEQALVKLALEPEWEARFEANSYGFRPGRCAQDAIEAIFNHIRLKPKFVLEADIEKCFDRIDHTALLAKLGSIAPIQRQVRGWLKAGIFENGEVYPSEAGTPQGGIVSPLLANIALHGLETALAAAFPKRNRPVLIRYADDFVILHEDLETLLATRVLVETWLAGMGLVLKPAKAHLTHTLYEHEGRTGFDFLGFTVRQFPLGKYRSKRGYKTKTQPQRTAASPGTNATTGSLPSGEQPTRHHRRPQSAHSRLDELLPHLLRQAHLQPNGLPTLLETVQMGQMAKPPQEPRLAQTKILASPPQPHGILGRGSPPAPVR